jgi:hypothetical protein
MMPLMTRIDIGTESDGIGILIEGAERGGVSASVSRRHSRRLRFEEWSRSHSRPETW